MYLKYGNPSATFAELKDKQLEHSFLQRDLVGLLLNKDGIYDNILIQLVSWSPNEYINECDVDMILPSCLNDDNKNYPIISLSDSEWGKVEIDSTFVHPSNSSGLSITKSKIGIIFFISSYNM